MTSSCLTSPGWIQTGHSNMFPQVGGYWDKSCSTVTQLKEGLNRILCLIPYNVISQPLWECFMPEWLEAIRTEVPDHQLKEFREVLRCVHCLKMHVSVFISMIMADFSISGSVSIKLSKKYHTSIVQKVNHVYLFKNTTHQSSHIKLKCNLNCHGQ